MPVSGLELDFAAERKLIAGLGHTRAPESFVKFGYFFAPQIHEPVSKNIFAGAVEQDDAAFQIGGDQAAAHGMDDVFGEILEVEQLFTLFFKLYALSPERLRQQAGQIGDGEKSEEIAEEPETQTFRGRRRAVGPRDSAGVREHSQAAQKEQAKRGDTKRRAAGKSSTSCSFSTVPEISVPVTTVPIPFTEKTRSMGSRK